MLLWTIILENLGTEATWCSLYPSASKARIEPFFSSLKTFLFNSFGMVNCYFFSNYFWGTASTVFAIQLVLLQKDIDDHSTGYYTFPH